MIHTNVIQFEKYMLFSWFETWDLTQQQWRRMYEILRRHCSIRSSWASHSPILLVTNSFIDWVLHICRKFWFHTWSLLVLSTILLRTSISTASQIRLILVLWGLVPNVYVIMGRTTDLLLYIYLYISFYIFFILYVVTWSTRYSKLLIIGEVN